MTIFPFALQQANRFNTRPISVKASENEILRIVEGRLAPSAVNRLAALGLWLERGEIDAVVIPARTLQHRRFRPEKLTVEESDRVLRVIRLLPLAESVYGSRERALAWLRRLHARLDGRTPPSLLKTDTLFIWQKMTPLLCSKSASTPA